MTLATTITTPTTLTPTTTTTTRTRRPALRRLGLALSATALLAVLATGCTSVRSSLGTSDSSCFRAIPVANTAVHSRGRFVGAHLFTESKLHSTAPKLVSALTADGLTVHTVCVVAFEGTFSATGVSHPLGRSTGKLAVVVASSPANKVLATVIFGKAPLHFGHPHVG
jgi:hypothetical protein